MINSDLIGWYSISGDTLVQFNYVIANINKIKNRLKSYHRRERGWNSLIQKYLNIKSNPHDEQVSERMNEQMND